jgi:hypothetical protein
VKLKRKKKKKKWKKKYRAGGRMLCQAGELREGRRIGLTAGIEAKFGDPSERTHDAASAVTRRYVGPLGVFDE